MDNVKEKDTRHHHFICRLIVAARIIVKNVRIKVAGNAIRNAIKKDPMICDDGRSITCVSEVREKTEEGDSKNAVFWDRVIGDDGEKIADDDDGERNEDADNKDWLLLLSLIGLRKFGMNDCEVFSPVTPSPRGHKPKAP